MRSGRMAGGNYSLDDGSLERVRYTGKPYPMLKKVHGYENGIELQFSSKLSGKAASQAKSYFVQQWNYEYSPAYGSLEYSVKRPSQEGHDRVRVKSVKILPDQNRYSSRFLIFFLPCKPISLPNWKRRKGRWR